MGSDGEGTFKQLRQRAGPWLYVAVAVVGAVAALLLIVASREVSGDLRELLVDLAVGLAAAAVLTVTVESFARSRAAKEHEELRKITYETLLSQHMPRELAQELIKQFGTKPYLRREFSAEVRLEREHNEPWIKMTETTKYKTTNTHTDKSYEIPVREEVYFRDGFFPMLPQLKMVRVTSKENKEMPVATSNNGTVLEDDHGNPIGSELTQFISELSVLDYEAITPEQIARMRKERAKYRTIYRRFKSSIRIELNESINVETTVISYLGIQDFYLYQLYFPTEYLSLKVHHPKTLEVHAKLLHPRVETFTELSSDPGEKRWELNAGIFPCQGICIHWRPQEALVPAAPAPVPV